MNNRLITIFASALLLGACAKDKDSGRTIDAENVAISLAINSLAVNDPVAINQDQTFGSMAIYVYDDGSSVLERSALLPSFSPTMAMDIPIETKAGTKAIYLIANYAGKTFKRTDGTPFTLTAAATRQELESITTESSAGFAANSLLMVNKRVVAVAANDNGTAVECALRRLEARVDVHVYKAANFGSTAVTLKSVALYNQILNSEVKFDYVVNTAQMLTVPMINTQTISSSAVLAQRVVGSVVQPSDAQAIFYSYQNLVTVFSPLQMTAPYLEITIESGGEEHTYKGYLTDDNQLNNKYSLLQNNVYQIIAVLDQNSKIVLNLNVLPWNVTDIDYQRPITPDDFSFGAWGSSWGGINGRTMYTNVGGVEDAVFQFELKAPQGAAWVATLTNGLDFTFASSTAGTSTTTVSGGFAAPGSPYLIAVRATKKWTGEVRDTEFYITVEGKEIVINPVIGTARRYLGTDTRIKIMQVASYVISAEF